MKHTALPCLSVGADLWHSLVKSVALISPSAGVSQSASLEGRSEYRIID